MKGRRAERKGDSAFPGEEPKHVSARQERRRKLDPAHEKRRREERAASQAQETESRRRNADSVPRSQIEVAWHPAGLENQLRPGHAAVKNVASPDSARRPALLVAALRLLHEPDAVARRAEAMSEFDVLDARAPIAGRVEATHFLERATPYGTEPAPEGFRLLRRALVNEMVEEILVLAREVRPGRPPVVRAECRVDLGVLLQRAHQSADRVRQDADVGVHEDENLAAGGRNAFIAGPARTDAPGQLDDPDTEAPGDLRCSVARASVVDDDDFVRREIGSSYCFEAAREIRRGVARRHDHGDGSIASQTSLYYPAFGGRRRERGCARKIAALFLDGSG